MTSALFASALIVVDESTLLDLEDGNVCRVFLISRDVVRAGVDQTISLYQHGFADPGLLHRLAVDLNRGDVLHLLLQDHQTQVVIGTGATGILRVHQHLLKFVVLCSKRLVGVWKVNTESNVAHTVTIDCLDTVSSGQYKLFGNQGTGTEGASALNSQSTDGEVGQIFLSVDDTLPDLASCLDFFGCRLLRWGHLTSNQCQQQAKAQKESTSDDDRTGTKHSVSPGFGDHRCEE